MDLAHRIEIVKIHKKKNYGEYFAARTVFGRPAIVNLININLNISALRHVSDVKTHVLVRPGQMKIFPL